MSDIYCHSVLSVFLDQHDLPFLERIVLRGTSDPRYGRKTFDEIEREREHTRPTIPHPLQTAEIKKKFQVIFFSKA